MLPAALRTAGALDLEQGLERSAVDGSPVQALTAGTMPGPADVDSGRPGSQHHVILDPHGIPLQVSLTAGNPNAPPAAPGSTRSHRSTGLPGRPPHVPRELFADRGDDHHTYRQPLRRRHHRACDPPRTSLTAPGSERTTEWSSTASQELHDDQRLRTR